MPCLQIYCGILQSSLFLTRTVLFFIRSRTLFSPVASVSILLTDKHILQFAITFYHLEITAVSHLLKKKKGLSMLKVRVTMFFPECIHKAWQLALWKQLLLPFHVIPWPLLSSWGSCDLLFQLWIISYHSGALQHNTHRHTHYTREHIPVPAHSYYIWPLKENLNCRGVIFWPPLFVFWQCQHCVADKVDPLSLPAKI